MKTGEVKQVLKLIGPIVLSALSIFVSFLILQPFALFLDSSFNLLSSRGTGKIAFTLLVILQIILFISILSKDFLNQFFKTNFHFILKKNWIKIFLSYFGVCFSLHSAVLVAFFLSGFVFYNPNWGSLSVNLILRVLFGFVATFFLAWTEELIFRGTIYPYLAQGLSVVSSLFITSLIFMFVHDITNPINMITTNWRLGLGLFLLGMMLNLIFIGTRKLYTGMGAHAGLVFVKVVLRRVPVIRFLPQNQLPLWINKDMRISLLVHALFLIAIIILAIKYHKKLFVSYKKSYLNVPVSSNINLNPKLVSESKLHKRTRS